MSKDGEPFMIKYAFGDLLDDLNFFRFYANF